MEKNIEICESLLKNNRWVLGSKDKEAIKKLITDYRKLRAKINVSNWHEKSCREIINSKYIPKSKIKEKIEELEEEKKYYYSDYKIDELNDKIQVLQELMEDK